MALPWFLGCPQWQQWRSQVPDAFRFLLKFLHTITHDRLRSGVDGAEALRFTEKQPQMGLF
jgi:uncharacterized protein YecE (DUF72 family)